MTEDSELRHCDLNDLW